MLLITACWKWRRTYILYFHIFKFEILETWFKIPSPYTKHLVLLKDKTPMHCNWHVSLCKLNWRKTLYNCSLKSSRLSTLVFKLICKISVHVIIQSHDQSAMYYLKGQPTRLQRHVELLAPSLENTSIKTLQSRAKGFSYRGTSIFCV